MRQRGQMGDGCVQASILCIYDRRKGDLFVLSWARVRRVCRGKFSSVLLSWVCAQYFVIVSCSEVPFVTLVALLLLSLLIGGSPFLLLYGGSPPASPVSHLAGLLRRRDPSTNPGPTAWCVSVGNRRDVVWYVRECDKGGRWVMGVLRRRFCVYMIGGKGIYLFLVGLGYDACAGVSSLQCCCLGCVRNISLLSLAARC